MLRLGFGTRFIRGRASFAASKVPRQQSASASEAVIKVCVISAAGLASVLVIAQTAERIADKTGQTAEKIATISKFGSAEEQETLKKTEKMAHAAALGSANGASDALKNRWWFLWPFSSSSSSSNSAKRKD